VSVIVQIPNNGTWQANGPAFSVLADEASKHLSAHDQEILIRGQAQGLVSLDQLDHQQAHRIAVAIQRASDALRPGLRNNKEDWDQSLADALDDLSMRLTELAGTQGD
jgi:hypothetical protein